MSAITESMVENAALRWLETLGYTVLHGPDIAAGEPGELRVSDAALYLEAAAS